MGQFNITCESGESYSLVITWQDSSGNPINNTSYTGNMDVRTGSGILIVNLNTTPVTGGGSITMGGSNGQITLAIAYTVTENLTPGSYFYDLFVQTGSTVTKLLQGAFVIEPRVTQNV